MRYPFRPVAACVALSFALLTGCGSSGGGSTTASGAATSSAPAKAISIKITAPEDGSVVRTGSTSVRGTVDPPDASVQVAGKPAQVANGIFSATASLQPGDNTLDVIATAEGAKPATTSVTVTRGKSQAQVSAAETRRAARERAARKRAAQATAKQKAAAAAPVSVPDEAGERLDVAEDDLHSRGLSYREVGGGTFGIVVKSNWIVCETKPPAGSSVKKHTRIALIVDREC